MSSACLSLWGPDCPPFIRGSSGAPQPRLHPGPVPLREVNPARGRGRGGACGVSLRGRVPLRARFEDQQGGSRLQTVAVLRRPVGQPGEEDPEVLASSSEQLLEVH